MDNNQGLCYYEFMVNLDKCNGSCSTPDDLSSRIYVPNKIEGVNLSVLNIILRINEAKTLAKRISCKCEYKIDDRKCNSNQKWNNNKCRWECKNPRKHHVCENNYIWNPSICTCKNGKYLGTIISDSAIMRDEIIEVTKTVTTKTIPVKNIPTKKRLTKKGKL